MKINYRSIFFLLLLFFVVNARASTVQFSVLDMTGATNDVTFNIKPANNPVIYNGTFYWFPVGGTNVTTTNGFAALNLIQGKYTASIVGQPQSWTLNVTNSATPISSTAISSGPTIYSGIVNLTGTGGIAITQTQPGTYNIDASQAVGSSNNTLSWEDDSAATNGPLLFEP
jgi:hypothetical protein